MRIHFTFAAVAASILCTLALPASTAPKAEHSVTTAAVASSNIDVKWDTASLFRAPKTFAASGHEKVGAESLFYEGLPYKGRSTRVFAYIGLPARKVNEKVPAMVLVHGGGGTAYIDWVRLWTSRGYAAIAMDLYGGVPGPSPNTSIPQADGGPHRSGGFAQIDEPFYDQWVYQSVGNVVLAHSLLRSRPEVDANRIGITGVSWGGFLTCITASVDSRFKFAVSVYGSGFIADNSEWVPLFKSLGDKGTKWIGLWDPSRYIKKSRIPLMWVYGTNDTAYPLDSVQKTYHLLPSKQYTLSTHVRMKHGHGVHGEGPEEIHAFANHFLKGGPPLAKIRKQRRDGQAVTVSYDSKRPILRAELSFTKDRAGWTERFWDTIPAELDIGNRQVRANLPDGVSVYYVSIIDDKGHVVSSEHVEVAAQ